LIFVALLDTQLHAEVVEVPAEVDLAVAGPVAPEGTGHRGGAGAATVAGTAVHIAGSPVHVVVVVVVGVGLGGLTAGAGGDHCAESEKDGAEPRHEVSLAGALGSGDPYRLGAAPT